MLLRRVFVLLVLLGPTVVQAARPMITDDARLVDAKTCQVESWVKDNRPKGQQVSTEFWALPSCNPSGNLELTFGGALGKDENGQQTTDFLMQGKTLIKPLKTNSWGLGMTVGNVHHPAIQKASNLIGDVYINIPLSLSFRDDRFVLHFNAGVLHDSTVKRNDATLGVGTETFLFGNTWLIAESYGVVSKTPFYQFGIRQWVVPNRLQIDATYGNTMHHLGELPWVSVGIRWLSDVLFK